MVVGTLQKAKRALVSLLKVLAAAYNCVVDVSRESSDKDVTVAFRKLSRRVHPDKGGCTADQQRLNAAYADWQRESRNAPGRGGCRKPSSQAAHGAAAPIVPQPKPAGQERPAYRVHSTAVLLTYQGLGGDFVWLDPYS